MTYIERIVNVQTGETIERPYNSEEIAQMERAKAEAAKRANEADEAASAKAALLEKLGITEEEAKLLLS